MELPEEKRYDYAKDSISSVITLSSGILALSLTFSKDWASGVSSAWRYVLQASWMAFLLSIGCGIASLLAVTGQATTKSPSLESPYLRVPWMAQLLLFGAALILLVTFGYIAIRSPAPVAAH